MAVPKRRTSKRKKRGEDGLFHDFSIWSFFVEMFSRNRRFPANRNNFACNTRLTVQFYYPTHASIAPKNSSNPPNSTIAA